MILEIFTHFLGLNFEDPRSLWVKAILVTLLVHIFYRQIDRLLYDYQVFLGYVLCRSVYAPFLTYLWSKGLLDWAFFHGGDGAWGKQIADEDVIMMSQLLWLGLAISICMRFVNVMDEVLSVSFLKKVGLHRYFLRFGVQIFHTSLLICFVFFAIQILELPISAALHNAAIAIVTWIFTLIALYFLYALNKNLKRKMQTQEHFLLGSAFLQKLILPTIFFLLATASLFSIQEVGSVNLTGYFGYKEIVQGAVFWGLFRLIGLFEMELLSNSFSSTTSNKTMVQATGNFIRVGLCIMLGLIFMNRMGYNASGIFTLLGGASFGLSFAGKDIVANYLSGMVMYFEGQFNVGDWIYSTDKGIEGVIEYIGIRTTSIRTFDKRLLVVPNSFFSSRSIVNASRMTNRRILKKIPLGWLNDMDVLEKIVQDIRLLVYNHPAIDKILPPMVHFSDFGTSQLVITIYALTRTRNWHTFMNVQENILREIKSIIDKYGGSPPVSLLHVPAKSD